MNSSYKYDVMELSGESELQKQQYKIQETPHQKMFMSEYAVTATSNVAIFQKKILDEIWDKIISKKVQMMFVPVNISDKTVGEITSYLLLGSGGLIYYCLQKIINSNSLLIVAYEWVMFVMDEAGVGSIEIFKLDYVSLDEPNRHFTTNLLLTYCG